MLRERALSCLVLALTAGLPGLALAAPPREDPPWSSLPSPDAGPDFPDEASPADRAEPGDDASSPPEEDALPGVHDEPGPPEPPPAEPAPDEPEVTPPADVPNAGESASDPPEPDSPEAPEDTPEVEALDAAPPVGDGAEETSVVPLADPASVLAIVPTETMLRPEGRVSRDEVAFSPKRRARRPASTADAPKLPSVKARPRIAALSHTVTRGETWRALAKRYDVDEKRLRRWNQGRARRLKPGEVVNVWVEVETPTLGVAELLASLPAIDGDGESVGLPNRGSLERGVAIPEMPSWWTLRRPDEAFGSSFAVQQFAHAIARYRVASGRYDPLSIGSMSREKGGKLRPHSSHQSGRDLDIRLPVRRDLPAKEIPDELDEVDWDAAWALVQSFIQGGHVEFIFLDASRQAELAAAGRRASATSAQLDEWLQWPRPGNTNAGIVRDEPGHTSHIHVRFRCGPQERECRSR